MFCFHKSLRITELVSDLSFFSFFLMVLFMRVNHRLMTEELSSIKKNFRYDKGSRGDYD
jgi:hypothetical protein